MAKEKTESENTSGVQSLNRGRLSRRAFLKGTLGTVVGVSFAKSSFAKAAAGGSAKSRVFLIRDPAYFKNRKADPAVARRMVDRLICALIGKNSPSDAWRALFTPKERIAIKVNCLYPPITTNPETVQAVVESISSAGINENRIVIFDRSDDDLKKCGFRLNNSSRGAMCFGTKDYVHPVKIRGVETMLSKILADQVDALINVPVMKHHAIAGITASLKNHLGTVPNPSDLHPDQCSRAAEVNALGPIRNKTRLVILDAAQSQYDGGPGFLPQFAWSYSGIMASTDTVAIDTVAARDILAMRHKMGIQGPIRPPIKHLQLAAQLGLGVGDLQQIEVLELNG